MGSAHVLKKKNRWVGQVVNSEFRKIELPNNCVSMTLKAMKKHDLAKNKVEMHPIVFQTCAEGKHQNDNGSSNVRRKKNDGHETYKQFHIYCCAAQQLFGKEMLFLQMKMFFLNQQKRRDVCTINHHGRQNFG